MNFNIKKILIYTGFVSIILVSVIGYLFKEKSEKAPMPEEPPKIKVVTTILPLYFMAKEIGGALVEVENIIPLSVQPWGHALSEDEKRKLEGAQFLLRTNTSIDRWVEGIAVDYPFLNELVIGRSLRLLPSLPLIAGGPASEESDAYFWLDPGRMMVAAGEIRDALIARAPEKKQEYWTQTSAFIETLSMIDRDFRERFKGVQSDSFVTSRNYMTYFIDSFGLNWVGAGTERPGQIPTADQRVRLRRMMRNKGISAFFTAPGDTWVQGFAAETGVTLYQFDSMEFATSTAVTYDAIMRKNMQAVSEALGYMPEME